MEINGNDNLPAAARSHEPCARAITDTDRLEFLIRNSSTWNPRVEVCAKSIFQDPLVPDHLRERKWVCGYWDDGNPNYGGGGEPITPEAEDDNPRTAIDMAITREREESPDHDSASCWWCKEASVKNNT